MERMTQKLGTALAATVLGMSLPAVAAAQDYPPTVDMPDANATDTSMIDETAPPQLIPVSDAVASMSDQTQALANLGPISSDDIVVVALSDLAGADETSGLMQTIDPSQAATLQQVLGGVQVMETGSSVGGYQRSLSDHLQMLGIDPASVVATNVDSDGTVTIYYR